jgi:uncharacterized protein (DUF1684 family)
VQLGSVSGVGVIVLVTSTVLAAAGPAAPVRLSSADAAEALRSIEKDRAETQNWLRAAPTSYLATIDRRDFLTKRTLSVGRATDNDVRIDDPGVMPHHLRVTVEGDRFKVEAVDAAAQFVTKIDDKEQPTRAAMLDPSALQVGRFHIRLSHQRFPALIVFDPKSPRFKDYKGIQYFPPDLAYRYELALTPNPRPEVVTVMSTRGNQRRATRVGWFEFLVNGTPCRLEALRLLEPGVGESELGLFFRDTTSGKESYGLGRYVDAQPLPNGKYLLDFNFAYNPACAYSEHYNCPIPPKTNALPIAIRAGEMDAHYLH